MNYSAGIVDDEADGREFVSLLLKNEFPQIEILFIVGSVEELDHELRKHSPDLLYLDIQLKNKLVFESKQLATCEASKVYITAYNKYGLDAIKSGVDDYLIKPINELEFVKTTFKILHKKKQEVHLEKLYNYGDKKSSFIDVPSFNGYKRLTISDIIRCESSNNYTTVFLNDTSQIVVSIPLSGFEKQLTDHNFCRIHQSHLINLSYFKEYIKGKGGTVVLKDNTNINVSVRKKPILLKMLSIMDQ